MTTTLNERNLALELVRVTEAAALSAARFMGKGDSKGADQAAVDAMRQAFKHSSFRAEVVIGEGERDDAPMLYVGELVGPPSAGLNLDLALDPLEGTGICARGGAGALSVIATAPKGGFLKAPDVYMDKIACGPKGAKAVHLSQSPKENLVALAKSLGKPVSALSVVILSRPRHEALIEQVRTQGARICLIDDGDITGAVATCQKNSGIDLLLGIGGAPEGVISAAAMRCMGGEFQGRLVFTPQQETQKKRAHTMGIKDLNKIYSCAELASGPVHFCATGVTDGALLKGIRYWSQNRASSHSLVMRSHTGTKRYLQTQHQLRGGILEGKN